MVAIGLFILNAILVVTGAGVLLWGLRNLRYWLSEFDKSIIFETLCRDEPQSFKIPSDGSYELWIKGPRFQRNPLVDHEPRLRRGGEAQTVDLTASLMRTNITRGNTNAMRIATFGAQAGQHVIDLVPVSQGAPLKGPGRFFLAGERMIAARIPARQSSFSDCFLQVRRTGWSKGNWVLRGIAPLLLGAFMIIGGMVGGALTLAFSSAASETVGTTSCNSETLERLLTELASPGSDTVVELASALKVKFEPVEPQAELEVSEYKGRPLSGSLFEDLIEQVDVRLVSPKDRPSVVFVAVRPGSCYTLQRVVAQLGRATEVDAVAADPGKSLVLRYRISNRLISLGFSSAPTRQLVSISPDLDNR